RLGVPVHALRHECRNNPLAARFVVRVFDEVALECDQTSVGVPQRMVIFESDQIAGFEHVEGSRRRYFAAFARASVACLAFSSFATSEVSSVRRRLTSAAW